MLVVLAADDDPAVLETMKSWSRCELLHPFIWWPGGDLGNTNPCLVDAGEEHAGDIGALLRDVSTHSVHAVSYMRDADDSTPEPPEVDERFEMLRDVLPGGRGPSRPALLVAPSSPSARFSADGLSHFVPVLVLSPEDRSDPGGASQLSAETAARHVAHALCLLGGAFADQRGDDAPIVGLTSQWAEAPGCTIVIRPYSRMLDVGYVVDHVGVEVLRPGRAWPNPDRKNFDRSPLSAAQVDYIVQSYLDEHERVLKVTPVEPIQGYDPPRLGLWEAIKAVFRFLLVELWSRPGRWLDARVGAMYDKLADFVEDKGAGSGVKVLRWHRREAQPVGDFMSDLLRQPLVVNDFIGDVWRDLRALPMGMIDGTPLPSWLDESQIRSGGSRQLVDDPRRLVPDPERLPLALSEPASTRACDPRAWESVQATVDPAFVEWRADRSTTVLWRIGSEIAREAALAVEQSVLPSADEWPDLEEVGAHVAAVRKRARRTFLLGWLVLTSVVAAAGATLISTAHPLWVEVAGCAASLLVWLLLTAVLWRRAVGRAEAAEHEAASRFNLLLNRVKLAMVRREDAIRLERRYQEFLDWSEIIGRFIHHPFLPRKTRPPGLAEEPDEESLPAAFRVGVGLISDARLARLASSSRSRLFAPRWLTTYYSGVEDEVMHQQLLDQGTNADHSGQTVDDPAGDVGQDPTSPRRVLLTAVRNGVHRTVDSSPISRELVAFLGDQPVSAVAESVATLNADVDARRRGVTATWVSSPEGLDDLVRRVQHSVVRVTAGTSTGTGVVVDGAGVIATAAHVVADSGEIQVTTASGTFPGRVTEVDGGDLALVEISGDATLTAARLATSPAESGAAIFHVGHQLGLEGQPTVSHGLVASSRRVVDFGSGPVEVIQTSYRSAPGGSGGPVFDLSGHLVAINVAGKVAEVGDDPYAEAMTFAVPVEDLTRLLGTDTSVLRDVPSVQITNRDEADVVLQEADDFLGALVDEASDLLLVPALFRDRPIGQDPAKIVATEVTGNGKSASMITIEECVDRLDFLVPIRVWVHRCDRSRPVQPSSLAIFHESSPDEQMDAELGARHMPSGLPGGDF